jgi:hypothetical protein
MEHRLVQGIQKALGWSGSEQLGSVFARGSLPEPELCRRLLTPTRLLDLVMRRSLSMDGLRCLVNGVDIHPRSYLGLSPARRGQSVPMADMQRIGRLLQSGCTLILDMAHFFDPTLEVTCRALQWWSHELVQVNLYLTTGEAAGFELHWDDHDVIVVQLAGEKSWEVRSLSRPAPMYRDAAPNPDPPDDIVWTGTMQAGDVMHIPRGYWHQATRADRGDGFSLHATFGISKRTGVDYLSWLADNSREIELFRHDLDRWGMATDRTAQQLALTDEAVRLVATRSVAEYLAARVQDRPAARHVATHGVFGSPMAVVCSSEFPPAVVERDDTVEVSAAGRTVTFAAAALPALRLLLSGRPVVVSALAASTGLDMAPVVQMLVEQGICAELTAELDAGYADWVS